MPPITIGPVGPETLPDYLDYFDQRAFADNPRWQSCYCHFTFADHSEKDWGERTLDENRGAVIKLISSGAMRGYLAYADGLPVAWCNAAPRSKIPLARDVAAEIPGDDPNDSTIGVIVCFIVSQPWRGQGIARQLLATALEGFCEQGLLTAEAYPLEDAKSAASNHYGPLEMYLSAGFSIHGQIDVRNLIVRKDLRAD